MHAILNGIIDAIPDARLHFPNGVRHHLDGRDIRLLRQAGTVSACFAIETASPDLQKVIRKNLDIDKAHDAIRAAVAEGIYSTGFFMLGLPGETGNRAMATVSSPPVRHFTGQSSCWRSVCGTELADWPPDHRDTDDP